MKTAIDQRIERAFDAFFEPVSENNSLSFGDPSGDLTAMRDESASVKAERWSSVIRALLLFIPGSMLLYYSVLSTVFFYPELGLTFQMIFMMLAGTFMCTAGTGNIREIKNLIAPTAVGVVASTIAIIGAFLSEPIRSDIYFLYSIYLFPIAVVFAVVAPRMFGSRNNDG